MRPALDGNCQTTAMGILPHRSLKRALELSLSLDIPFWPQLPKLSFYEDMYVQFSEHLPGIVLDPEARKISFSQQRCCEELPVYLDHLDDPGYFRISPFYSLGYGPFLGEDLSGYPAVRGQCTGPVSLGLQIPDENKKPLIYDDQGRELLYDFLARKISAQHRELSERNGHAFVWIDEPGLDLIFAAFSGYSSERARADYALFLEQLPRPRAVHLCCNPDWSFLLGLDLDILSVDILSWGEIFSRYSEEIAAFLDRGGIISWGISPTLDEVLDVTTADDLARGLESLWDGMASRGVDRERLAAQAWLAPARCWLAGPDESGIERSFLMLQELARIMKDRYGF